MTRHRGSCIGSVSYGLTRHAIVDILGQVRRSAIQTVAVLSLHLDDDVFIKVWCFSWDVCWHQVENWLALHPDQQPLPQMM